MKISTLIAAFFTRPPSLASLFYNDKIDSKSLKSLIEQHNNTKLSKNPHETLHGKKITLNSEAILLNLNLNSFQELIDELLQKKREELLDEKFKCRNRTAVFKIDFVFPEDEREMLKLCGALAAFKIENPNNVYLMKGDLPVSFFSDSLVRDFCNTLVNELYKASDHPIAPTLPANTFLKPTFIFLFIITLISVISLKPQKIIGKCFKKLRNSDRAHPPT